MPVLLWTFIVRMLMHGKPRSRKTTGRALCLPVHFPVVTFENVEGVLVSVQFRLLLSHWSGFLDTCCANIPNH